MAWTPVSGTGARDGRPLGGAFAEPDRRFTEPDGRAAHAKSTERATKFSGSPGSRVRGACRPRARVQLAPDPSKRDGPPAEADPGSGLRISRGSGFPISGGSGSSVLRRPRLPIPRRDQLGAARHSLGTCRAGPGPCVSGRIVRRSSGKRIRRCTRRVSWGCRGCPQCPRWGSPGDSGSARCPLRE